MSGRRVHTVGVAVACLLMAALGGVWLLRPVGDAPAAAAAASSDAVKSARPPAAIRLDAGWARAPDPHGRGLAAGRQLGQGDGRVPVSVPDVTVPVLSRKGYAGSIWWYDRQVAVPKAAPGGTWALRFEGVRRKATVYVAGRQIGTNADPYAPFEVEIPADLTGRTVTVAVRVDGRRPKRLAEGWWNWTGITRPVELVPRGRLNTVDPDLQGQASCSGPTQCTTGVRVRAEVKNRTGTAMPARARLTVTDPDGEKVASAEQGMGTVPGGASLPLSLDLGVPHGRLWTPSDPALYRAQLDLLGPGGRVEQTVTRSVGLRTVTVAGGRLQLNGHDLRLRGASIQEDVPGHGAALTDADVQRTVQELEDVGANVTRAHYSLDERLLSALDRAGIMVWEQAPVYQPGRLVRTRAGRERARATNERAVIATRDHPSVIVHSVANEPPADANHRRGVGAYLAGARRDAETLDPTVPAALDLRSLTHYPAQRAYRAFAVLGVNSYFGWYQGPKRHSVARAADFAPFLARTRRRYPTSALVVTEMGAEGVRSGSAHQKGTFQFQAAYLNRQMNVIDARPDLSGAIYWTLREFGIRPGWTGGVPRRFAKRDGLHRKGLLTYAGAQKPVWAVARARLDGSVWALDTPPRVRYGH